MYISTKNQAINFLLRSQKILCVTSEQYSHDALCAVMSLQLILSKLGKDTLSITTNHLSEALKFLLATKSVKHELGTQNDFVISISTENTQVERVKYTIEDNSVDIIVTPKEGKFSTKDVIFKKNEEHFDVICILDTPNLENLGTLFNEHTSLFTQTPIINISVNPMNDFYGKINLVEPDKSTCCEIIYDLIMQTDEFVKHLDNEVATTLLTGIISHTESFLKSSTTTVNSLEVAADLQEKGARHTDIINHLYKMKSMATLKTWGRILSNLELDTVHKLAWSRANQADFTIAESRPEDITELNYELLRHTKDAELITIFIELKNSTKVQIRSSQPSINLLKLKTLIGGTIVKEGIDIDIPKNKIHNVEHVILRKLLNFQKEKHNIPYDIPLKSINIHKHKETHSTPKKSISKENINDNAVPRMPIDIPFEAKLKSK